MGHIMEGRYVSCVLEGNINYMGVNYMTERKSMRGHFGGYDTNGTHKRKV